MKKNQGFSLVELIVVIAIMAVLVGVLAPAYLRYVEKSRKSTDVSAISDIMAAGEKVAIDPQFSGEGIVTLTVAISGGTVSIDTSDSDGDTMLDEWVAICNGTSNESVYTIKSKAFQDAGTFTGTIEDTGAVTWSQEGADDIISFSPDFAAKWGF